MVVRGGEVDASRSCSQVEKERGVVRWEARRLLLEREMRTREMLGNLWLRAESWERKCRPTPPAPGEFCQIVSTGPFRLVVLVLNVHKQNRQSNVQASTR